MRLALTLLLAAASFAFPSPPPPPPPPPPRYSQLWISYSPVSAAFSARIAWTQLDCGGGSGGGVDGPLPRACAELQRGLSAMLGRNLSVSAAAGAAAAGAAAVLHVQLTGESELAPVWPPRPALEGYSLTTFANASAAISSRSAQGALYGAFRLLHLVQREDAALLAPPGVVEASSPGAPLRMWDLWDNLDSSVERGYAGPSVVYPLARADPQRMADFARLLSSVGVNAIVWDNVNACGNGNELLLASSNLRALAPFAALFHAFGIHSLVRPAQGHARQRLRARPECPTPQSPPLPLPRSSCPASAPRKKWAAFRRRTRATRASLRGGRPRRASCRKRSPAAPSVDFCSREIPRASPGRATTT